MNKLKTIYIVFLAAICGGNATAQGDVHYSQFYTAPTYLNPATAGAYNGDIRFFSNYRTQWKSVTPNNFRTITAGFDAPIRPRKSNNNFGAGINFYNDKAGDGQLVTNNFNLTGSYILEVDKQSFFSMGIGIGLHQRSIDFTAFYWDNQWNGETFDQAIVSGENGFTDKFMVMDLGAGIYYYSEFDDGLSYFGGLALNHINKPNVSFLASEDKLMMKTTVHGGLVFPIPNSKIDLKPNVLVALQGPNKVINFGSDFKYYIRPRSQRLVFNDEISMAIGTYYRVGDAAYMTARFNYAAFSFGAAYDYTLSDLSFANNGQGGMEFFFSYITTLGQSGGISMFR